MHDAAERREALGVEACVVGEVDVDLRRARVRAGHRIRQVPRTLLCARNRRHRARAPRGGARGSPATPNCAMKPARTRKTRESSKKPAARAPRTGRRRAAPTRGAPRPRTGPGSGDLHARDLGRRRAVAHAAGEERRRDEKRSAHVPNAPPGAPARRAARATASRAIRSRAAKSAAHREHPAVRRLQLAADHLGVPRARVAEHTRAVGDPRHVGLEEEKEVVRPVARRGGHPLGDEADGELGPRTRRVQLGVAEQHAVRARRGLVLPRRLPPRDRLEVGDAERERVDALRSRGGRTPAPTPCRARAR